MSAEDQAITPEALHQARIKVPRILYGIEANPFVPLEKTRKSWFAWIAGVVVTFGNALNNAGQAFFNLGAVAGAAVGGGAALGTGVAMVDLYGKGVIPGFQRMLTHASQEEEYLALLQDLDKAKELGLDQKPAQLQAFLRKGFEERRQTLVRKKFRELLAIEADKRRDVLHNRLTIDLLLRQAQGHAAQETDSFFAVLERYFAQGKKPVLKQAMVEFFTGIYRPSFKTASADEKVLAVPAAEEEKKIQSLFEMEVATLESLKQARTDGHFSLDLESAFTKASIFQQWLWVEHIRGKRVSPNTSEETEAFKAEKNKRIAKLKTALGLVTDGEAGAKIDAAIESWEQQALEQAQALVTSWDTETQGFFPQKDKDKDKENQRLREELRRYRQKKAEQDYNTVFSTPTAAGLYYAGYIIGTFGALGNAALGYVGVMALIKAMGLSAIPAAWAPILALGLLTGFFSSFLLTRLFIIRCFEEFGRYLDKFLSIEIPRLRYTVLILSALGSAAPAWFAFYAGKMLVIGFAGAGSAVLFPALLVGLVCGLATFFGAGALMVASLYNALEPYVLISQDPLYSGKLERFEMMARLFFLGQRQREEITFEKALRAILVRVIGLGLLVGAVASQIQLGVAPLMILGSVFAAIGMAAMYSGVFGVAGKAIDGVFAAIKWCMAKPQEGLVLALLGVTAVGLLELSIASAGAWISDAAFLGISANIGPSMFAFALLSFVAVLVIMVYQYRAELAKGKSLEEADKMLSSSSSGSNPLLAEVVKGTKAEFQADWTKVSGFEQETAHLRTYE